MSHHQVLGLPFGANLEMIKAAYRRLIKTCHPDTHPDDPDATRKFIELTTAYNALIGAFPGQKPIPTGEQTSSANMAAKTPIILRRTVSLSIGELLRGTAVTLEGVGGICSGCGGTGQRPINHYVDCLRCMGRGHSYREKGIIRLKIDCVACEGLGKCKFMPCEDCGGYGASTASAAPITVPAGTLPGSILTIKGAASDPVSGTRGDLEILVAQSDENRFRVEGADIECDLPLAIWDLALGTSVTVTHPLGHVLKLKVPSSTAVGKRFVLPRNGFPGEEGPGSFVVITTLTSLAVNEPAVREALLALKRASSKT